MISTRTQSQLCTATPISLFVQCHILFWLLPSSFATLFNELCEIDMNLPNLSEKKFLNIILYGTSLFSDSQKQILNSTIE